jgi:hypothetical protein
MRELVRGIDAVDVEAGIGLGIAQRLRLVQHFAEVAAGGFHRRQDVIAGAVEHAVDVMDHVGGSPFAQPLDDRNAARDRRFILQGGAGCFGGGGEFDAMVREHRLVGGHQRLAPAQRRACERERGAIGSADQFDHGIHIVARGEGGGIVDPVEARQVDAAIARAIARGDGDDLDSPPGATLDQIGILRQQLNHTAADGTQSGQRDAQLFRHYLIPQLIGCRS